MVTVERVQTGVRIDRQLLKVLKALAEYLDLSLGDLLEGIVLHAFEQRLLFDAATIATIGNLNQVYGMKLSAADSHNLIEREKKTMLTDACERVSLTGTVAISLPPEEAFVLFTPSGERRWAHGWCPKFPHPGPDETEFGTVFLTDHGGHESTWAVIRSEFGKTIGYCVLIPEVRCGVITITCARSPHGTVATVNYDLTALHAGANAELNEFASNYAHFLEQWEHSIAETVDA